MSDLVSVIIPFFNEEKFIGDSISSILNQTYDNLEIILVDDYSTDKSIDIIKKFKNKNITLIKKSSQMKGPATSRNLALKIARGNFIAIQDADDTCDKTRIEKQLDIALNDPNKLVIGSCINSIKNNQSFVKNYPEFHNSIVKKIKRKFNRVGIVSGTLLASKKLLCEFSYRPQFKYLEDWDMILRMCESNMVEFYNCQEPLYNYFLRKSNSTSFNPERVNYNLFLRNCEQRRNSGLHEFSDFEEFSKYIKSNIFRIVYWTAFKTFKIVQQKLGNFT